MGLGKRLLDGAGYVGKGAFNLMSRDNLTPQDGGGLTSAVITKQVNMGGYAVLGALSALGGMAQQAWQMRNDRLVGQVTYQDGLTRMASSHTTGAVPAMMRASKGDYQAFAGMAGNVLKSPGLGRIDDFGANPAMISALYNMGGR